MSKETNYFNLNINGLGYITNVRQVVNGNSKFTCCTLNALSGPTDNADYPILTIFQCQRHRGKVRWRLQVFCCYERWLMRLSGESVCLAPAICRKASMSG